MIFTHDKYRAFLRHAKELGAVITLKEYDKSPGLILRHDVDLDIEAAYNLSRIEIETGVRSSYFIMTSSETYNIFSPFNRKMISQLALDGFEIGLHFDPAIYESENIDKQVMAEALMLGGISGRRVESVSLHNPSLSGEYPLFNNFHNAYDPEIFNPDCYLSDSRMEFRQNPHVFIEKMKKNTIQILLHPMHFTEAGDDYSGIFTGYLKSYASRIDCVFKVNSSYLSAIGGSLYKHLTNKME